MLFNSFAFLFGFLPVAYLVFWALRSTRARYLWLTVTGYAFYSYWNPKFCLLMAFSTLVSYSAGLVFLRYPDDRRARRLALVVPITIDLLLLGFFKYANFLLRSIGSAAGWAGMQTHFPVFDIVLPVGISFYTFHTITYIVDSYRGTIRPTRHLLEFSAYVSLFSQLVAGPIVRFRQIEADLEALGQANRTRWLMAGMFFFLIGLTQKVLLADNLARLVDPALARYHQLTTADAWLAMAAYTFQLYFDFCGYSLMAVGLGYLFGLRIPQNFNSPYRARNPSDFWQRWHISLSTCLRDYLYIPFGGNRSGTLLTYRNVMLTMLIGGLWHGANWTFVLWGAYHGALLISYRALAQHWDALNPWLARLLTFVLVLLGWVLFRSTSLDMAMELLARMFAFTPGISVANAGLFSALVAGAAALAMFGRNTHELQRDLVLRARHWLALAAAFGACLASMAGGNVSPFLYFQF